MRKWTSRRIVFRVAKRVALGVTVGDDGLTLAAFRRTKNGPVPELIDRVRTPEDAASLLKKNKLRPERIFCSVAQSDMATKFLRLPSRLNQEINDMLRYQMPRLVPLPPEQVIYGWQAFPAEEEGYSDVAVTFVRREIVEKTIQPLRRVRLIPDETLPESWGLWNWLRLNYPQLNTGLSTVIWLDGPSLSILLLRDSQLLLAKGVTTPAEEPQAIAEEVLRALEPLERRFQGVLQSRIFLAGSRLATTEIQSTLRSQVPNQLELLADLPHEASKDDNTDHDLPQIHEAIAIGLSVGALHRETPSVSLTPPEIRARQLRARRIRQAGATAAVAAAAFLLLMALIGADQHRLTRYKALLEKGVRKLEPSASRVEAKRKRLQVLEQELATSVRALDVLTELARITPDGITFSSLTFEGKGLLDLSGQADTLSRVLEYTVELEDSPYFYDVDPRHSGTRTVGDTELTDFQIKCLWREIDDG